jgi:uncharacterized membrane protein
MEFIAYYFLFSLVCLIIFIFHYWLIGEDLRIGPLFGMIIGAFWPLLNILLLLMILFEIVSKLVNQRQDGVLLRGRKFTE